MEILRLPETDLSEVLDRSSALLDKGKIIAYPTETLYGLGARYDREEALKHMSSLKRRPRDKAMPLIIGSRALLPLVTPAIPPLAQLLMDLFWPGPLTLIMVARENLSGFITAGTGKVAVRIPGKSFAYDLAVRLAFPITATSANISGMPPAETAAAAISYFGNSLDIVIDCGKMPGSSPTTIVDVTGTELRIVRQGIIPAEEILVALEKI
jgi:L-threonylcarbamoyladenylate synthase